MKNTDNSTVKYIWEAIKKQDYPMTSPSVVESIGDAYKKWHPKNPVFIDAPTGSGKTTFVYEKLIRHALSKNKTVLLVSNRIALSLQQKKAITEIVHECCPGYKTTIPLNMSTDEMKELFYIGPVCVATYQGLFSQLNQKADATRIINWAATLQYVIFDEIHFLYSDALFNPICGDLLRKLPHVFNGFIRIYMTATSWDVLDSILQAERFIRRPPLLGLSPMESIIASLSYNAPPENYTVTRCFNYYYRRADYSSYRLHFFNDSHYKTTSSTKRIQKKYLIALLNNIIPTASSANKWLILVDKKSSGEAIMQVLKKEGIRAAYVDSKTKNPQKIWEQLIQENKFDVSALIATSVIDSGVNIIDPTVKNIAILSIDHTSFIQLIGRKRCTPGEIIDLWVWLPNDAYFKRMAEVIKHALHLANNIYIGFKQYHKYPSQYAHAVRSLWDNRENIRYPSLFYIDSGSGLFNVNYYAYKILKQRLRFVQHFIKKDNPLQFENVVMEWLCISRSLVPSDSDKQSAPVDELCSFLDQNIGISFPDVAFKSIRSAILAAKPNTKEFDIRPERRDNCSPKTLNRILEHLKLPYFIKKKANVWTISRMQPDN